MSVRRTYNEAQEQLRQLLMQEIESGLYLNGDHMTVFGNIMTSNTAFTYVDVFYMQHPELINPVSTPHIQILFSGKQFATEQVGHWIVAYHNGCKLFIYDSLNTNCISPDQVSFISRLFPDLSIDPTFVPVQTQNNLIDCGVYAIANAVSLALGRDPSQERYVVPQMRPHLANMFRSGTFLAFPTEPLTPQPNDIEMDTLHITSPTSQTITSEKFPTLPAPRRGPGRPLKQRRGRPEITSLSKEEKHRAATKRYADAKPDVHRKAVKKYAATNPDVHKKSAAKYKQNNPEVNKKSVAKHRQQKKSSLTETSKTSQSFPTNLRQIPLLGMLKGVELNVVKPHFLKQTSLHSPDTYNCKHCGAALFEEERGRDKWCCGRGAYHISLLPPINASFYHNETFLKDARSFNNLFSFSAIGVSGGFQSHQTGISFVKILGRTYHRVFDLSWQGGPNNCGMYIDDGVERMRLAAGRSLDSNITQEITSFLNNVNPFVPVLRRLGADTSEQAHIVFQQTTRRTHGPILGDVPIANEIAAIFNTDAAQHSPREVVIWKVGEKKPHTVSMFHPSYECLQYPLLFPHGTEGWYINKLDNNNKKLSQVKYYRYLLLSQPRFTKMRRLSQEYFVDMFCRTEEERLRFIANNQGSVLRVATRQEIDETITGEGGVQVGRIYLPSSFTNSPRYMQVKYQDGMAIVQRLGKPTYFLTVTCNPNWQEIKTNLNTGEQAKDRPDLCDRVFQLKLSFLINQLKGGKWFGNLTYILHVIEFQKRGLPHAHICFKVKGTGPVESGRIDEVVQACIPSANETRLRQLVLEHMVHGPQCTSRKDLPCVDPKTKKCTKLFPKPETDVSHVDDRGYVHYKRSAQNTAIINRRNKKYIISDQDIVPYNPTILLQMECHSNIEIACTRKIVKYLFKYIHKGPDAVRVNIISDRQEGVDEIENYVTRRYIGASDAIWRLLEFDVTGRYPAVVQLPVHLLNKDHVVYRPGDEQNALEKALSKLVVYMARPQNEEFSCLTYCDFFENYILDTKERKSCNSTKIFKYFVTKRIRGKVVARIYWVSPLLGELYYLRLLLLRFPCFSFEDLRTIEGTTYSTFQEAARAVGLLSDENEFSEALIEAAVFMTGRSLRKFFYILISNGAPAVTLWDNFKNGLCEDFLELYPQNTEKAYAEGLCDIDRILRNHGSSLADMGLPEVQDSSTEIGRELMNWCVNSCTEFVKKWETNLSEEQRQALNLVKDMWCGKIKRKVLFIDGAGGTGKTLLLNVVTAYFRANGLIVLCTATTGVAALLHDGGVTAHSKFKLPLSTQNNMAFWSVSNNSQRAELIKKSSLIIWDEAPMAHKTNIEVLDRSLQNLMESRDEFGGKIVIFSGDFRQIPPVIPSGTSVDAIGVTLKQSYLWNTMRKVTLSILQRSKGDDKFSKFVLSVGNGSVESVEIDGTKLIPLTNIGFVNTLQSLIDFVYPSDVVKNPDDCCSRAILSGTNANTREINEIILAIIPGESVELLSADTCVSESSDDEVIHTELLNTISQPRVPDHKLILKVGAVCILMRNLCFDDKLVNGTKLIITQISRFCISARRPNSNTVVVIPRITFKFSVGTTGMEMIRRQFPLQLAFGLTINKSQGQTLKTVGVDLRNDVFAHGQLYVALSRVRSSDNIKVLVRPERVVDGVAHCVNVVHKELVQ